VSVLVDGVVSTLKRGRTNGGSLLVGDLGRRDDVLRVASSRRGDGGVEGLREVVAKRDARNGSFHVVGPRLGGTGAARADGPARMPPHLLKH